MRLQQDLNNLRSFEESALDGETAAFMWKIYWWMSIGLGLTGLVAWLVAHNQAMQQLIFANRTLFFGLLIGEVAMVVAFSAMAHRVSTATAAAMFLSYAAVNGLTMSFIFLVYTQSSVASVFFVTAGSFAGLSLVGYTTKKDLSGMRSFLVMGLIGIIIGSIVNIFLGSPLIYWFTTFAGVLIFAGLTVYDTQKLKQIYRSHGEGGNLALLGALTLYLDFINLLLFLLRLFGKRR